LSLEAPTQRKYKNVLAYLKAYCERKGVQDIMQLTVEHLDAFRATRRLSPTTPTKGITDLATVFRVSPQQIDRYMCLPCRVEFNARVRGKRELEKTP
jgi:hypothetical protein